MTIGKIVRFLGRPALVGKLRRSVLVAALATAGCIAEDFGTGVDDDVDPYGETGSGGGSAGGGSGSGGGAGGGGGTSQTGPYWMRNDGQRSAFLSLSGSVARACSGGTETIGTFRAPPNASMTYVINGNTITFPLEFRGNTLLVGVPSQAVNTNTATEYIRSSTYACSPSTGGGGGGSGGGGSGGGGGGSSNVGRITFFTTRADGGRVPVTVAGQVIGTLTEYFPNGRPNCRQTEGVVYVDKPAGTYPFSARDEDGRTWSGNVTATAGGCMLMSLD